MRLRFMLRLIVDRIVITTCGRKAKELLTILPVGWSISSKEAPTYSKLPGASINGSLVGEERLELSRIATLEPKSSASTNSATRPMSEVPEFTAGGGAIDRDGVYPGR